MKRVVVGILYRIVDNNNFYLLVSSKYDFGKYTGLFYPAGGHVEKGENELDALKREVFEELSIKVEPTKKLLESQGDVDEQITSWWICKPLPPELDIKVDESEVREIRWLSEKEIVSKPDLLWPATYKFFTETLFQRK